MTAKESMRSGGALSFLLVGKKYYLWTQSHWAWATKQSITPQALKHFIRQQQWLEVSWCRHAVASSWSVEGCRVCTCRRARETHLPPDGLIHRTMLKGFCTKPPSLCGPNNFSSSVGCRIKSACVTLQVKGALWNVEDRKVSLRTPAKTHPLGMESITLSAAQERFSLISQYPEWHCVEMTTKEVILCIKSCATALNTKVVTGNPTYALCLIPGLNSGRVRNLC